MGQNQFFLSFFSSLFHQFLEIPYGNSQEHCQTTSRVKTHEKISGALNWVLNQGFYHFLKVGSLVFLDIAQFVAEMIFSFLSTQTCLLYPRPWPAGSYKTGSVHPSVLLFVCPQVFSGLAHQFFLKINMVLGAIDSFAWQRGSF